MGIRQADGRGLKLLSSYGGILKSNVSDYLELVHTVYKDACAKCIADVSDLRDLVYIESRVKYGGLSFLTINLPQFCRDFERSLANGVVDSTSFKYFKKFGSIPAFLRGMISQIFDIETGRIFDDNKLCSNGSSTIVEAVRQICLTFKKLEMECTPERTRAAFDNFIAIERSFETFSLEKEEVADFRSVSSVLWDNMVHRISLESCIPSHGPGATAESISGNQKYNWRIWHERLEPYFPFVGSAYPLGIAVDRRELENITFVAEELEQPVRVVAVPKTLKSPRIIAIEPCCMQYTQQGIRAALYKAVGSNELSTGHVEFRDQGVNQKLAIESSSTGLLATVDLSDASDRVPHELAMEMFRSNPDLQDAIEACRSTRALMPSGLVYGPLRKFASMGSALCFPVEAMYFYTICVMALLRIQHLPVNHANCLMVSRDVHVYGDDIIVPTTYAMVVLDYLRKYNCKINTNKTFVSGSFRESCGVDAFLGYEVTPTYIGKECPKNLQQADRIVSWTATANLFYSRGYWLTARLMFKKLERILGVLPYLDKDSEGLGKSTFMRCRSIGRWNGDLHRFEVEAWVADRIYRTDRIGGFAALMKSFLDLGLSIDEPFVRDVQHLERSALHHAVALKRGWVPTLSSGE